jgi:hypothetical protein
LSGTRHACIKRQQRSGEIAVGMCCEQVARHCRHVAHLGAANLPGDRMKKIQLSAGKHIGHRGRSTDPDRITDHLYLS